MTRDDKETIITALLLLTLSMLFLFFGPSWDKPQKERTTWVLVVTKQGDTLWGLAEKHYPGGNTRNLVEQIKYENNLAGNTIEPGMKIWVLVPNRID